MKQMSFAQMEEVKGGDYCSQLRYWVITGNGYQGNYSWLCQIWMIYCVGS